MKGKLMVCIVFFAVILGLTACGHGKNKRKNDEAQKEKNGRYLTVINATDQIINEVHVYVGEGTEIESAKQKNIAEDETSFSILIPKDYKEYDTFTVELVDRYENKYRKNQTDVKKKGRTEVKITKDDKMKQKGSLKRSIDQFFNGD